MDIRTSKLLYLGLPTLLLVLYVVFIPSPSVSKIHLQDNLGYIAEGYDLTILNLSSIGQITPASSYALPYWIKDFTIENGLAYVITKDNSIHIMDAQDPFNLKKLSDWTSTGLVHSVAVDGSFAFLANHTEGVRVLSIQDTLNPYQLLQISDIGTVLDVAAAQNLLYVARGSDGLDIYDISNISKPEVRGHYDAGNSIHRVTLLPDGKALLQVGVQDLQIINLSNPQNIILTNTFTNDNEIIRAVVNNNRIFVVQKRAGVLIVRIKEDSTLERLIPLRAPQNALDVALIDNTIFIAAGSGGVQAVDISKIEDIRLINSYSRFWEYKRFIGLLVAIALLFWLAFFAQFVLPVRTFVQRQMIFNRLILFLIGKHGPAIFIENGRAREQIGESQRKGPGVLWLDTASATVVRTATRFKEAIGPGVYFTEKKEFIAGTVDLHTQVDSLGPSDDDNPFIQKPGEDVDQVERDNYNKIQKKRMEVSALTRDGIEVVPKISVTFRVDTMPAEGNQKSGSRFGYRTGISKADKENEANDKKAIYKAITGEGINPSAPTETPRHRVAWNHLPILLAVDVWREYVAKFTLDELFEATQEIPPALPPPADVESSLPKDSIRSDAKQEINQEFYTSALHDINEKIKLWLDGIEGKNAEREVKAKDKNPPPAAKDSLKKTALQVINEMIKSRLTMPHVGEMDSTGHRIPVGIESKEYQILSSRGLKVISVSVSNPRVNEIVEQQRIKQWKAAWLSNAKAEHNRIERQRSFIEIQAQEHGANKYAHALALHIMKQKPQNPKEIVKALLMRTRLIILRSDQLQRRMSTERQDLDDILQWMEEST